MQEHERAIFDPPSLRGRLLQGTEENPLLAPHPSRQPERLPVIGVKAPEVDAVGEEKPLVAVHPGRFPPGGSGRGTVPVASPEEIIRFAAGLQEKLPLSGPVEKVPHPLLTEPENEVPPGGEVPLPGVLPGEGPTFAALQIYKDDIVEGTFEGRAPPVGVEGVEKKGRSRGVHGPFGVLPVGDRNDPTLLGQEERLPRCLTRPPLHPLLLGVRERIVPLPKLHFRFEVFRLPPPLGVTKEKGPLTLRKESNGGLRDNLPFHAPPRSRAVDERQGPWGSLTPAVNLPKGPSLFEGVPVGEKSHRSSGRIDGEAGVEPLSLEKNLHVGVLEPTPVDPVLLGVFDGTEDEEDVLPGIVHTALPDIGEDHATVVLEGYDRQGPPFSSELPVSLEVALLLAKTGPVQDGKRGTRGTHGSRCVGWGLCPPLTGKGDP